MRDMHLFRESPSVVFRMPTSESVVIGMPSVALRMPTFEKCRYSQECPVLL